MRKCDVQKVGNFCKMEIVWNGYALYVLRNPGYIAQMVNQIFEAPGGGNGVMSLLKGVQRSGYTFMFCG